MKAYVRGKLLILAFAVFLLLLLSNLTPKSISQNQIVNKVSLESPVRLTIPSINVNAKVEHTGVNFKGEMEVPSNTMNVGWFKLGSRPGEKGSAVISGHLDGKNGETGVFANLHKLKKGDKLYVEDNKGKAVIFVVRESRIYDPGYAEEVFGRNDSAYLNLVTCDGVWDGVKKSYTKRLVVFADITH